MTTTPRTTTRATPPARTSPRPPRSASSKSPPATTSKKAAASKLAPRLPAPPQAQSKPPASKQSQLLDALKSPSGISMAGMTQLTGWQAHTVRATISATLRKKLGHEVVCIANEAGARMYRIPQGAKKA